MNTLENKNILITGATRGIGNKLATHFASQGANIVLLASNEESLNTVSYTHLRAHETV